MHEWMTGVREWADRERKKIGNIPGIRKKSAYIWEYYKLWIIGIVFFTWFISFAIYQYTTILHDYWCFMVFTNTYADAGNHSDLWEDYTEYAGFDLSEKAVEFNASSYFDYLKSVTGNTYFQAFVAFADSGTLDGITSGLDSLAALGETGRLLDLSAESCTSIQEKYQDRFVYCEVTNQEGITAEIPVGVDISDSRLVTVYQVYAEPCALGISAKSDNVEAVELFLDFIFSE